jgi:chromosome segregation ATPase
MTMTISSLQKDLEEYPERLQRALKRQARAEAELKRIKEQIAQAEAEVDDEEEVEVDRQPVESADYQKLKAQCMQY